MSEFTGAASQAINQPQDDVVEVLLAQHARIRELFAQVKAAAGEEKRTGFDELRALLAAHETGEEMVLRSVSAKDAGSDVADARNQEEQRANRMLADLEKMDLSGAEFDDAFAAFERAVLEHADREEREEFPPVREREDREKLASMGRAVKAAERVGPTHPHPSTAGAPMAQWVAGPFASLVDRARDAISGTG
jgi:hypothetical protein